VTGTSEGEVRIGAAAGPPEHIPPAAQKPNAAAWLPWLLVGLVVIGLGFFALGQQEGAITDLDGAAPAPGAPAEAPVPLDDPVADPEVAPPADVGAPDPAGDPAAGDPAGDPATGDPAGDVAGDDGAAPAGEPDPALDPAAAADGAGTLRTDGGEDVFAAVQGDDGDAERLAPLVGQEVQGVAVLIQQVVEDQGFWIGSDEQQRIFVVLPAGAQTDVEIAEGGRLDLVGMVQPNPPPEDPAAADLTAEQGAAQQAQQGHRLELSGIAPSDA
jgi:hypothetical protein